MAIDWAVWGPPMAVLGVGVVMGVLTLTRLRGSSDPTVEEEARLNDLRSTHEQVVLLLKQLEVDRNKLSDAEYTRERELLVARGSRALEAMETGGRAPARAPGVPLPAAPAPVAGAASGGLAPEWKGAAYALGAVGVLATLWWFATQDSVERRDGAPMSGNQGLSSGPMTQAPPMDPKESPEFKQRLAILEAELAKNPTDLRTLNDVTQLYFTHGDPGTAMQFNDRALAAAPTDLDARTYRGVLAAMMSLYDRALESLDGVIAEAPDHAKALTYKGLILLETGRNAEAVPLLEKAVALQPQNRMLPQALAQARGEAPRPGSMPPQPPTAGGERIVAGTFTLDPAAAAAIPAGATLFFSVKDPARPGPPVAADKREAGTYSFPMSFELTTAHIRAMPGAATTLPATVDLTVRIDPDGNAMTRETGFPSATLTGIQVGSGGLNATLSLSGAPVPAGSASLLAPLAPAAPMGAAVAPGDVLASGTATLDPAVASSLTGSEVVFVSIKDAAGGPPVASIKVGARFPLQFQLTGADVLAMGGPRPVPDTFNVTIRVDRDGNAMTKEGEPEALLTSVRRGARGLELTLK